MQVEILILDFGSQYTQLIARRLREEGIYSEIVPYFDGLKIAQEKKPKGIIFSGGPASVYDKDAYRVDKEIYNLGLPILGICYGMQLITVDFGGEVVRADHHEYGKAELFIDEPHKIFKDVSNPTIVWMSHSDRVEKLPNGFKRIAHTSNAPYAAIVNEEKEIYAIQPLSLFVNTSGFLPTKTPYTFKYSLAAEEIVKHIKPGQTEIEIAIAGRDTMEREIAKTYPNAEYMDTWVWLQSVINTDGAHNHKTNRALKKGDILSLNTFPMISGYYFSLYICYNFIKKDFNAG
jgi:GMP synthase (glutamine-hydrolysing) A subunit